MANDRIYIRCKTCLQAMLFAKFWGAGKLGPVFQMGFKRPVSGEEFSASAATGEPVPGADYTAEERLDIAHGWLTRHLQECAPNGWGSNLGRDAAFDLVTEDDTISTEATQ